MYINHSLIETIQEVPDTVLHLTTGKSLMVQEKAEEVTERIINFHKKITGIEIKDN